MSSQAEIQASITLQILTALEEGIIPWRKPWLNDVHCGAPMNVISHKEYRGINPLLLDLTSMIRGFKSRYWGTYQQWQSLGGQVKKRPNNVPAGRWGTTVVFWRQIEKRTKADDGQESKATFPLLRCYTVFNLDQVEGESVDRFRHAPTIESLPPDFDEAQRVIDATEASIAFGGNQAYYTRLRPDGSGDSIVVPHRWQFPKPHEFYGTCFHELVHWSEARLNWTGGYAMGELIAEIGSSFLCQQTNIPCSDDVTQHVSYLASWLKELQNDRRAIFKAAAQASKATDFILSFSRQPEAEELTEQVI